MTQWYYTSNNQQQGPISRSELTDLCRKGVVTRSTLVWSEGMASWMKCDEVILEVKEILPPPIPQIPPPIPHSLVTSSQQSVSQASTNPEPQSGCMKWFVYGTAIFFGLVFVGLLGDKPSQNTGSAAGTANADRAKATYTAASEFMSAIDTSLRTTFAAESARVSFVLSRASEIARTPNIDPDFQVFLHTAIGLLDRNRAAFKNFEAEVNLLSNQVELLTAVSNIYGSRATQSRNGGELAELIVRLGIAAEQQQQLNAIFAKHGPIVDGIQAEWRTFIWSNSELFHRLSQRYPQYDFNKL